jgi:capsular exopolysaccharide synthesis family protein
MILILAFVLGGIIGIGSVLVVEQQDQSVKNAEEIEHRLGLPVIGALPRAAELERSRRRTRPAAPGLPVAVSEGLLQRLKGESVLGLEFKRIYLKLARARGRTMPRTLLVTSATRAEGKTTTSACLAITLARELREKLLLVDFDLRRPALHRALGLPTSSWGLAQMLQSRTFDERFVRTTVLPNLDFLPAGRSERTPAELIDDASVEWFLREAVARYPYVLLDAAPNLAVPDPLIIGRAVQGVVYVIKAGSTIRKAAEYGVRVQREACDNVVGVLMNDLGEILPHYYGYHQAYGQEDEEATCS